VPGEDLMVNQAQIECQELAKWQPVPVPAEPPVAHGDTPEDHEDSKALRTLKRVGVAWPLVLLPFVPTMGKVIAAVILTASLH
jgi:hypothetical protein